MKTLVISDLHGKSVWKDIIKTDDYGKIVFLGDYVDCFGLFYITQIENEKKKLHKYINDKSISSNDAVYFVQRLQTLDENLSFVNRNFVSDENIVRNLQDIIEFKKSNKDKVILLMGNHDVTYIKDFTHFECSGHNRSLEVMLSPIFTGNKDLFRAAYATDDVLFTHAGVNSLYLEKYEYSNNPTEIADKLNKEFNNYDDNAHIFLSWDYRPGPFWQRPGSLKYAEPLNFWQVVGHTDTKEVKFDIKYNICYADCLNFTNQFIIVNENNIGIRSL